MATDVLQDFLVSVRYGVDSASQKRFLEGLAGAAKSLGGVAAAAVGLTTAILAMAKSLASAGEQLYFMGQRLNSSVQDIEAATGAMTRFGVSADTAKSSMEQLAQFQRTMGPGATMWLRSLGITATDATQQMIQAGETLRRWGGTRAQRGSAEYARAWSLAQTLGIASTQQMEALTSGQYAAEQRRVAGLLQQSSGMTPAETDKAAENAHRLMNTFRDFGTVFDGLRTKFGATLFPGLNDQLQRIFRSLQAHLPELIRLVTVLANATTAWFTTIANVMEAFDKLDPRLQHIIEVLALLRLGVWRLGLAMLSSPLGRFIAMLSVLLLLIDDYMGAKAGKKSAIDWKGWDDFIKSWTGIEGGTAKLLTTLGAIVLLVGPLRGVLGILNLIRKAIGWGVVAEEAAGGGLLAGIGGFMSRVLGSKTVGILGPIGAFIAGMWPSSTQAQDDENKGLGRAPGTGPLGEPPGTAKPAPSRAQGRLHDFLHWFAPQAFPDTPAGPSPRAGSDAPAGSKQAYYDSVYNDIYAAAAARELPHPEVIAAVGAAQSSTETGYGLHYVGNRFGIKAVGDQPGETAQTREVINGQSVMMAQKFAKFAPHQDAAAYVEFLQRYPKFYSEMLKAGTTQKALDVLEKSHYATDPNYRPVVEGVMNKFNRPITPSAANTHPVGNLGLVRNADGSVGTPSAGGLGNLHHEVTINVAPGPNADATAHKVLAEQGRVNETLVRNMKSSFGPAAFGGAPAS